MWRKPIGSFLKSCRNSKSISSVGARTETVRSLEPSRSPGNGCRCCRRRVSRAPARPISPSSVFGSARWRRRDLSAAALAVSSLRCPASLETPGLALRRFASSFACKPRADHPWSARSPHAAHPWQARSAGKGSIGPFAYAASPLRSRHLCILHIRIRNVEGGIDNRILRIRFSTRPGIIFLWRIVN